jgi:hypothetical protein
MQRFLERINALTVPEAKRLLKNIRAKYLALCKLLDVDPNIETDDVLSMIGKQVFAKDLSSGKVWYGTLMNKKSNQIILNDAYKFQYFKPKKGLSTIGASLFGIDQSESLLNDRVKYVWIEAIEIIPASLTAIQSFGE